MTLTQDIFPATAARLAEWQLQPGVLGVLLVGSKSRDYADALSDDDLEVLLTDAAFAPLAPAACSELLLAGEGDARRIIYDAELTSLADLQHKRHSHLDLDHWPYEKARILFDRDGRTAQAVAAAGRMDSTYRSLRLQHATIDAWIAPHRARKTLKRGFQASSSMLVARGARALARLLFALEWRWVPMDHWLEPELRTLNDPTGAGARLSEALKTGSSEPLIAALDGLEDTLFTEGVARAAGRRDLFMQLIHPSRAEERALHGLI